MIQNRKLSLMPTIYTIAMMLTGIGVGIYLIIFNNKSTDYSIYWLVPITFSFICIFLLTFQKYLFKRISITIMVGLYYLRMVILPVIMNVGNYFVVSTNIQIYEYMDVAILLLCYEAIFVFVFISMISWRLDKKSSLLLGGNTSKLVPKKLLKTSQIFKIIIFFMVSFMLMMIISNPKIIDAEFNLIFGSSNIMTMEYKRLGEAGSGTLGILVTLFNYIFTYLQILIPPLLIIGIAKKKEKTGINRALFRSLIVVAGLLLIVNGERGNSVMCAVALLVIIIDLYPHKMKKLAPLIIVGIVCIAVVGLLSKAYGNSHDDFAPTFSYIMSSYFSGPQNVAAAILASKSAGGYNIGIIFTDFVRAIPFLSSLVKSKFMVTSSVLFGEAIYGITITTGRTDQILPAIGQGYFYFGFLLAPVIPCILAYLSIMLERKALRENSLLHRNIFYAGSLMMAMGPVCDNLMIMTSMLIRICIVLVIASTAYSSSQRIWAKRLD